MPSKRAKKGSKGSTRGKKLSTAKKMKEVKPLASDYFIKIGGVSGE